MKKMVSFRIEFINPCEEGGYLKIKYLGRQRILKMEQSNQSFIYMAIIKHDDQTLYLVRETKGTRDFIELRTTAADKVRCGKRHFESLGVSFAVAVTADEV
jgi:hypothetical protein